MKNEITYNMKRHLKFYVILFLLLIVIIISFLELNNNTPNPTQYSPAQLDSLTLNSLKKVDNYPFYTMIYYGDYEFDNYLKGEKDYPLIWTSINTNKDHRGCTCFTSMGNKSEPLYGRNFDYHNSIPLILYTKPDNGYASISMVDIQFFGYNKSDYLPDSINSRKALLNAPWLPIDGINEKGVTIGLLRVEEEEPPFDPQKVTINEVALIRLVLDYAKNTEHAISLIRKYNVNTSSVDHEPEHFLIADPNGNSAIIEFLDNQIIVIKNQRPWQVATNFNIHRLQNKNKIQCERYKLASELLKENAGNFTPMEAMKVLEKVSQFRSTKWSCVYNMSNCILYIAIESRYDNFYKISLKDFDIVKDEK